MKMYKEKIAVYGDETPFYSIVLDDEKQWKSQFIKERASDKYDNIMSKSFGIIIKDTPITRKLKLIDQFYSKPCSKLALDQIKTQRKVKSVINEPKKSKKNSYKDVSPFKSNLFEDHILNTEETVLVYNILKESNTFKILEEDTKGIKEVISFIANLILV